jgi:hypothetical protein
LDKFEGLKKRLKTPLSLLAAGLLLCALSFVIQNSRKKSLLALEERAIYLYEKKHEIDRRKEKEEAILDQMEKANRIYIQEVLESYRFLNPEIEKLQILKEMDPKNRSLKERLDFLTSKKNALQFKEKDFQQVGKIQETDLVQDHPVEMSSQDLKFLLSQIEYAPLKGEIQEGCPPYFLIKKFDLLKKKHPSEEETFLIQLEMMKQET